MIEPSRSRTAPLSTGPEPRGGRDLITRRDVLKGGGAGLIALGTGRGTAGSLGPGPEPGAVILLAMVGGASPWETFDPKPDAPSQLRGPFGSIATALPGIRVTEHLPEVARRMGRLILIRSLYHDADPTHTAGLRLLATGRPEPGVPTLGAEGSRVLGSRGGAPPFVILPDRVGAVGGRTTTDDCMGSPGQAFEPFVVGRSAASLHFDPARLLARADAWVDRAAGFGLPTARERGPIRWGDSSWDWAAERDATRAGYGPSAFGRDCWLAGRFVAAGSRLVVVNMAASVFGQPSWDAHGRAPFRTFADYADHLLPAFDRGFTGLVDDLQSRGLLDSTLVLAVGEFGRTPWINESGGRDHWPAVWSALAAGGGTTGGQVLGSSTRDGQPADRPIHVAELVATMGHVLGLKVDPMATAGDRVAPITEVMG